MRFVGFCCIKVDIAFYNNEAILSEKLESGLAKKEH